MTKVAILNDTHCGVRNSSDIFIDYQERFYRDVFFPYLDKHKIKTIIHLGDYYDHRKYVNFKALNANRKHFLEPMRDRGITMDIICGNHDVYYKNTNELCSLKELLGHFTSNVNIILEPKVMDYSGLRIGLVPWINNDNYTSMMRFIETCEAEWLAAHLELNGFELMKGVVNTHGMEADPFKRFESVLTGHFHTKSQRDNIMYLGSQMEFTWADAGDPKYFHIIDTQTRDVIPVRNPITIFEKILYNDEEIDYNEFDLSSLEDKFVKVIVVKKTDPFSFDRFIDRIQTVNTYELKIAETFEEFMGDNVMNDSVSVEDTTELLDSYIDAVDTQLDKDRMKGLMRSLYVEAQVTEIV